MPQEKEPVVNSREKIALLRCRWAVDHRNIEQERKTLYRSDFFKTYFFYLIYNLLNDEHPLNYKNYVPGLAAKMIKNWSHWGNFPHCEGCSIFPIGKSYIHDKVGKKTQSTVCPLQEGLSPLQSINVR